jgi:signal transduction histidine kinase
MRERVADLGGELRVASNREGTVLTAMIPIPAGPLLVLSRAF